MGPSAALHVVRPRRLLRRFAEQACDEALPEVAASHDPIVRARRGLGLLLPGRADGGEPSGAPRRVGGAPLLRAGAALTLPSARSVAGTVPSPMWLRGGILPNRGALPVAQHLALEIVVDRLPAEPHREERVGEVLPRNRDLLPAARFQQGAASRHVRDDDLLAALQIRNRLQEAVEPRLQ